MPQDLSLPDPGRFDLKSFADILPARPPIIGEEPGSFKGFRQGLLESLAPTTPYECVVAENLVSIEWELLQHRVMRDAGIRRQISDAIVEATVNISACSREHRVQKDVATSSKILGRSVFVDIVTDTIAARYENH